MQSKDFQETLWRIKGGSDDSLRCYGSNHWACITAGRAGRAGWVLEEVQGAKVSDKIMVIYFYLWRPFIQVSRNDTLGIWSHDLSWCLTCGNSASVCCTISARIKRYLSNLRAYAKWLTTWALSSDRAGFKFWFGTATGSYLRYSLGQVI